MEAGAPAAAGAEDGPGMRGLWGWAREQNGSDTPLPSEGQMASPRPGPHRDRDTRAGGSGRLASGGFRPSRRVWRIFPSSPGGPSARPLQHVLVSESPLSPLLTKSRVPQVCRHQECFNICLPFTHPGACVPTVHRPPSPSPEPGRQKNLPALPPSVLAAWGRTGAGCGPAQSPGAGRQGPAVQAWRTCLRWVVGLALGLPSCMKRKGWSGRVPSSTRSRLGLRKGHPAGRLMESRCPRPRCVLRTPGAFTAAAASAPSPPPSALSLAACPPSRRGLRAVSCSEEAAGHGLGGRAHWSLRLPERRPPASTDRSNAP